MRYLALLLVLPALLQLAAQPFDPEHPPNTYRNADNPHYWRNRPPHPGYWQQDVHYLIKARLDDATDVLEAELSLTYWNNSPDTLREVYFHLTQEAFVEGSYLEARNGDLPRTKKGPLAYAGTRITSLTQAGTELEREQDNTVLRVHLQDLLAPGERTNFRIHFTTHWTMDVYRRMKLFQQWGWKHYDGVHWYPRIAVYDARFGWDTQQHLGHEFYGDYGTFDVDLDLPHHYVLDATGTLQNPEEVMPADLKAKLSIANFKDKPWNSQPSVVITPEPGKRKVWRFHAENVHDFAWTADPTYRIGEAHWKGIKCVALVQEPHAAGWQNAASYTARIIACYSTDFGMYAYPKMIVADARDGMEYPMLTLDGGRDPDYRGLLAHEVGHNWFFGMVGNNETYRAFLDEGFTQFLTAWALEAIDGDTMVTDTPATAYERRYLLPERPRESEVYGSFQRDAVRDQLPPINVHSDEFTHHAGFGYGYGHVYVKTATMLYNLQYTLGDSLFLAAMQHYFAEWRMCHPYPEDFRQSIIGFTKVDLNWFFDQWIDTDRRIDYAVRKVERRMRDGGQRIHLRRIGDLHMPIDLRVIGRNGSIHDLYIPNTWFEKRTEAKVLPRWIGYDELNRDHVVEVDIPSGIEQVIIDPTDRLADANMLNNRLSPAIDVQFDHHIRNQPDRTSYEAFVRPDLWWNGYDGAKVGVHLNSSYLRYKHRIHFTGWLNTGMGQSLPPYVLEQMRTANAVPGSRDTRYDPFSFNFRYENGTERIVKGSTVNVQARVLDGLERYGAGWSWKLPNKKSVVFAELIYLYRRDSTDLTYLLYPDQWDLARLNGFLDVGLRHHYGHARGMGDIELKLRNSAIGSASGYSQARLTVVNSTRFGGLELRTRGFGQFGTGATPRESALYLAGASPEEMMENKYTRSIGFVPYDQLGYGTDVNHFAQGGGMGLRGYAGYLAPDLDADDQVITTYTGNTGISASAEVDIDGLVELRPGKLARYFHLDVYLFGDVGMMGYRRERSNGQELRLAEPRADAGLGAAFTIKRFGPLVDIKPLTIRFDVPLFLSATPSTNPDNLAFRYVVAVGRSF